MLSQVGHLTPSFTNKVASRGRILLPAPPPAPKRSIPRKFLLWSAVVGGLAISVRPMLNSLETSALYAARKSPIKRLLRKALPTESHINAPAGTKRLYHGEGFNKELEQISFEPKTQHPNQSLPAGAASQHKAYYCPAEPGKPTFICSMGNAMRLGHIGYYDTLMKKGFGVVVYDYPGYGRTSGTPNEESCYAALRGASDFLRDKKNVPLHDQVAYGMSLGGAITAHVAQERPFKAVILQSTMTRFKDVVAHLFPSWVPVHKLLSKQNEYKTVDKIHKIQSPLLIMHGINDHMMPIEFLDQFQSKLKAGNKSDATLVSYPGEGHNMALSKEKVLQILHVIGEPLNASRHSAT